MNKYRIRILQLLFFSGSIFSLFYQPRLIGFSVAIYVFLEIFIGNATLHRYFGHRSFKMKPFLIPITTWLAHHIGVGSVLGWSGHHRLHHLNTDTPKDIHSPKHQGIIHILFGVWDVDIPRSAVKDLVSNPKLVWWHRNYFKYHTLITITLFASSIEALIYLYCLPNFLCLCSGYLLAIAPHSSGKTKNSILAEFFTFGEGWHKYHHDNPADHIFSRWDITGKSIEWFLKDRRKI